MTLTVALTGGIASGKTAVANAFARRGVPIVDTDVLAREVVMPGTPGLAAVIKAFGTGILGTGGALDRRRLRELVFQDPESRRELEAILHPAIREATDRRLAALHSPYAIVAIPLLAETGGRERFDRVLVVDVPRELQKSRLMTRDGDSAEQAEAILASQASREARLQLADDRIENTGTLEELDAHVARLHAKYLAAARDAADPGHGRAP